MIQIDKVLKTHEMGISELAEKLNVSRQTIHYYVKQGDKNSFDTLIKIANAIGCEVSEFIDQPTTDVINCPYCGGKIKVSKE